VTAEIGLLEEQLKELKRSLDGLWEGRREVEYELVAVYMHRGERDGHSIQQQCLCTILELVPVFYGLQALGDEKCSCWLTCLGKTSGAGHYWTYQAWLPEHGDQFFKYNDETVTSVPKDEVLEDRTGSDANPALLCYVRKGQGLIDTLHREILEREEIPVVEGENEGGPEDVEVVMSNVDKDVGMGTRGEGCAWRLT
jgi:ubiquitin carboxyl-terminal hydrolase 25/28